MYIYIYIYTYIYIPVSLTRVCIVYMIKEVVSFWEAPSINERGT